VENLGNNEDRGKNPGVNFKIEPRLLNYRQREAGNRLFRRLIDRVSQVENSQACPCEPQGSARVDGGSRHRAGSPPHLLSEGFQSSERDG
jgi:hypothetical protein